MEACHITSACSPQEAKDAASRAGSRAVPRSSRTDGEQPATICFPFAGGIMGGSHISALKLIGALDRKKYRPLIVLHDDRGQFADFLRAEGVAFQHAPTPWHLPPARRPATIGQRMGAPKAMASPRPYPQHRVVPI